MRRNVERAIRDKLMAGNLVVRRLQLQPPCGLGSTDKSQTSLGRKAVLRVVDVDGPLPSTSSSSFVSISTSSVVDKSVPRHSSMTFVRYCLYGSFADF